LDLGAIASARLPGFPADQVVAQSPPANAVGVSSPKINLLVAAPAEPEAFVMPDLVGKLLADATVTIESAGMKVGKVSSVALSAEPQPGGGAGANGAPAESAPPPSLRVSTVVRQNPPSGQKVVAGTTVSLEVAR
jgi:beta-lactam-binding protein with PASTA domain